MASETVIAVRSFEPGPVPPTDFQRVKLAFRTIDTAMVPVPTVRPVAPDVRVTERVVAVVRADAGALDTDDVAGITARYLEWFADDRDFLIVVHPPRLDVGSSGGAYRVRNAVGGLGIFVGEGRFNFGPSQRLQLVVQVWSDLYESTRPPDGRYCLLSHELTHRWAAPWASG